MKFLLASAFALCSLIPVGHQFVMKEAASELARQEKNKTAAPVLVSFAPSDTRYPQLQAPAITEQADWHTKAWKGEKVHTQILLRSADAVNRVEITVNDLKDGQGNLIKKENISTGFVQYV